MAINHALPGKHIGIFMLCLLIILLLSPACSFASAEELPLSEVTDDTEQSDGNGVVTKKLSEILQDDGGMKEFKPVDLDKLGEKALKFGDKSFETLQKFSIPMLIWGLVIGVGILFFGLIFGKKIIISGVTALVIVVVMYLLIRFFPEVMHTLINGVKGVF
jgi:hypothetical protein